LAEELEGLLVDEEGGGWLEVGGGLELELELDGAGEEWLVGV